MRCSSKRSIDSDYNEMYRYFKSHYKLVKLAEFAKTWGNQEPTVDQLVIILSNPNVEGFFTFKLGEIATDEDLSEDPDAAIEA